MQDEKYSAVKVPLTFLISETAALPVMSEGESGTATENDTKDPYSDNSDTV